MCKVYYLYSTRNLIPRYVEQTIGSLKARLSSHISDAKRKSKNKKFQLNFVEE